MSFSCWKCGRILELAPGERVPARGTCPNCDADFHVCRNCNHYDPGKYNQCRESQAEWVRDKEASNYCDYFTLNPVLYAGDPSSTAGNAKKKFESLFKS